MIYIVCTFFLWLMFKLFVPWREWRDYYPVFLFTALLGTLCDLWGIAYGQWLYHGPTVGGLSLWAVVGMAAAEGGLFIRLYPAGRSRGIQGLYLLGWSVINTFCEWWFVQMGWIDYLQWNPLRAFVFYILFFGSVGIQEYAYNGTKRLRKG